MCDTEAGGAASQNQSRIASHRIHRIQIVKSKFNHPQANPTTTHRAPPPSIYTTNHPTTTSHTLKWSAFHLKSSSRYAPTAFAANNHTRTLPLPIFLSILPKSPWQNTISGWPSTFPTASQHTRASQLIAPILAQQHTHTQHTTHCKQKYSPRPNSY